MGCATSKLDDLPAVTLCRDRCNFLEDAIRYRYALADAHVTYVQSLKTLGLSLHRFFDQYPDNSSISASETNGDPIVPIRKPSVSSPPAAPPNHSHSNSNLDSHHIQFNSDSEEDEDRDGDFESFHQIHNNYLDYETLSSGFMSINYTKNQALPTRSVAYSYPNYDPSSYEYNNYSTYNGGSNGNFFHAEPPPHLRGSESKPPPPLPPAPPGNSAWEFLNFFEAYERYEQPPHTPPSRVPLKEVEEKVKGIYDVEDGGYEREVVKEIGGDEKFGGNGGDYAIMAYYEDRSKPSVAAENDDMVEYEVHMVDKNVVSEKELSEKKIDDLGASRTRSGTGGASEVMREMQVLFERASESGTEVSKMLEAGKLQYHQKKAVYHEVSSKMLHVITPSFSVVATHPCTSKSMESSPSTEKIGSVHLGFDEDMGMSSGSLSSTLKKLHIWENKLYDEVKAEEKLRIIHERKSRRLKRLDEKGAEAHKIDSTRTLVRTLYTKIKIAIQVVDKISITISKLRDEELWPQINKLIHGIMEMWKAVLECHRCQSQAVAEAKSLDATASNGKLNDAHLEAAIQLKLELQNWNLIFSNWIYTQKGYVKALNGWLLRCLLYEPEETPDGIVPFSPSRIGAPSVFVICNQWSQALERLSEKEVIEAMQAFFMTLNQLLERHNVDLQQRIIADKDMERKVEILEREKQKIQSEVTNTSSLLLGLKQIFEAMERFSANSMQAYEELCARIEDDRHAPENPNVP